MNKINRMLLIVGIVASTVMVPSANCFAEKGTKTSEEYSYRYVTFDSYGANLGINKAGNASMAMYFKMKMSSRVSITYSLQKRIGGAWGNVASYSERKTGSNIQFAKSLKLSTSGSYRIYYKATSNGETVIGTSNMLAYK